MNDLLVTEMSWYTMRADCMLVFAQFGSTKKKGEETYNIAIAQIKEKRN